MFRKSIHALSLILIIFANSALATPFVKGIYINQSTIENTAYLKQLIQESKEAGINTFVIDLAKITRNYQKNVRLVKGSGIRYVARIVVFPDGGQANQIKSSAYWEDRYKLVESAIGFGADEIQLDYIRYSSKQPASAQNAKDVKEVIKWFKTKMAASKVPLQIDIFGEVSFKESPHIGQNIQLFADSIDSASPMVYPSHYAPYQKHSKEPYQTVYNSLQALKKQFNQNPPFKLIPYVEASNYHYKMSGVQKATYVMAQIQASEDAKADGWYVWSPGNVYSSLFSGLKNRSSSIAQKQNNKNTTQVSASNKTPPPPVQKVKMN